MVTADPPTSHPVRGCAPGSFEQADELRWACETFRVDDELTGAVSLWVPDPLRHRQFVLGLLGHSLCGVVQIKVPLSRAMSRVERSGRV